jgi:hypothetical protein
LAEESSVTSPHWCRHRDAFPPYPRHRELFILSGPQAAVFYSLVRLAEYKTEKNKPSVAGCVRSVVGNMRLSATCRYSATGYCGALPDGCAHVAMIDTDAIGLEPRSRPVAWFRFLCFGLVGAGFFVRPTAPSILPKHSASTSWSRCRTHSGFTTVAWLLKIVTTKPQTGGVQTFGSLPGCGWFSDDLAFELVCRVLRLCASDVQNLGLMRNNPKVPTTCANPCTPT